MGTALIVLAAGQGTRMNSELPKVLHAMQAEPSAITSAADGARITLPATAPILYALPAQLLAYHAAIAKGTDIDQPRNLAKSVTVE